MTTVVALARPRKTNRRPVARRLMSQALHRMAYFPGAEPPCCPHQNERLVPYQARLICSNCGTDPKNPRWTP